MCCDTSEVAERWCDGGWEANTGGEGNASRGSVSPLLANVYLHYVFDLWVHQWRKRHARGEVIIVRFAMTSR